MSDKDVITSSSTKLPHVKTDHYNATIIAPVHPSVSIERSVPQFARPPWPEWTDVEINKETWEENESLSNFEDITGNILPPSIRPSQWVRPPYLSNNPKVIDWTQKTLDLISTNIHLCEMSEAIRYILSEISELFDHAKEREFKCEGEDEIFTRNSPGPWNPWDHVYSLCKAGVKGSQPVYNPNGRYYVRLYYMGCWRRITVDDRIPILKNGQTGLPMGKNGELWPMLLTKGLLKVAWLTSDQLHGIEINQFSSISCLTGWTHEWHNINAPITGEELWMDLVDILPKYKPPTLHLDTPYQLDKQLAPTTSSLSEQESQDLDEFGEPIIVTIKPPPTPPKEEHPEDKRQGKGKKYRDSKSKKYKDKTKKGGQTEPADNSLVNSETVLGQALTEENPDEETRQKKTSVEAQNKEKGKGKKGKKKAKEQEGDEIKDEVKKVKKKGKKNEGDETNEDKKEKDEKVKDKPKRKKNKEDQPEMETKKKGKKKKGDEGDKVEGTEKEPKKQAEVGEDQEKKKEKKKGDKAGGGKKKKGKKALEEMVNNPLETDGTGEDADRKYSPNSEYDTDGSGSGKKSKKGDKKAKKQGKNKSKEQQEAKSVDNLIFKAELKEKLAKRAERIENGKNGHPQEQKQVDNQVGLRQKIPQMQDIILGVQKYSGIVYQALLTNFEENSGKDLPIVLTVIFNEFPKESDQTVPVVPSFLYHPVQLYEIRDVPLAKPTDRPVTPLWKTFRWKAWAMKKGIIPMEQDHFKDSIRSVKIHTPFALKSDWYNTHVSIDYGETYGEGIPEDGLETEGQVEEYSLDQQSERINSSSFLPVDKITSDSQKRLATTSKASFTSTKSRMPGRGNKKSAIDRKRTGGVVPLLVNYTKPIPTTSSFLYKGEMMGEGRMEMVGRVMTPILPDNACGSMWLDVENLASHMKKFCKFYSSRTSFGSAFTLRRSPRWIFETPAHKNFDQEPTKPIEITNFHRNPYSRNLTTNFSESKTIHVMSHHLDDLDGFDSGFYIFTDSWTEQEMIFDLEVLQLSIVKKFMDTALEIDAVPDDPTFHDDLAVLKTLETPKVNITMVLEPWDWRNDCCIAAPVVCGTTQTRFTTHVPLPPGRNAFRLWLIQDYPEINTAGFSSFRKLESIRRVMESHKRNNITQFSLKIISKTPMNVGTREDVQNYLTNEPVLLLKQCDALAHNIWTLLLSFGKSPFAYSRILQSLRKSYCPSFTEPNPINKLLKSTHATFEECFVNMIQQMNDERMDHWLLLALRSLFLNPTVGHVNKLSKPVTVINPEEFEILYQSYESKQKLDDVQAAVLKIQRYYRGWRVRRLFQARIKGHKYFSRLEFQIRRIALLLAKHTDSSFSVEQDKKQHEKPSSGDETEPTPEEVPKVPFPPKLSIIPQPPKWTVDLMRTLFELHPMLITIHPHAYCVPLHVKIKDIEGTLPSFLKDTEWLPFCRQSIVIPNETKWTYCEFDLQVHPRDGIMLKVVNNETMEVLQTITNRLFLGRLPANQLGYTIICYRWAHSSETRPDAYRLPPSKHWKLRIISPQMQKSIQLRDFSSLEEEESPKRLNMYCFTGYYIPSPELCVCRYTLETTKLVTYLSLRFKASNPKAQFTLKIIDLVQNLIVFEFRAIGAFLIPSVRIEGQPVESPTDLEPLEHIQAGATLQRSLETLTNEVMEGDDQPSNLTLNRSSSEPAIHMQYTPPQRYLIYITAKENTWNLSDDEWSFTQKEKKKFWSRLLVNKKAPKLERSLYQRLKPQNTQPPEEINVPINSVADVTSVLRLPKEDNNKSKYKNKLGGSETSSEFTSKLSKATSKKKMRESKGKGKFEKDKNLTSKLVTKTTGSKSMSADITEAIGNTGGKGLATEAKEQLVYEDIPEVPEVVIPYEEHEPDSYETANVKVHFGGPHSVKIKEPSQPHWILEIVTDKDQEVTIKSNLRVFNDKLEEMKDKWEKKQAEMLAKGLVTRVHCISKPGAYSLADPFTMIKILTTLEDSLYMDEIQMNQFTYGELLTPDEARAKAIEDKLAEENAKHEKRAAEILKSAKVRIGKGKHGTRAPPPTPVDVSHGDLHGKSFKGDLFPASNAGSDFQFEKVDFEHPYYSIFPIDLSEGSPSFLELARKLALRDSASSSSENLKEISGEMEGEGFDYGNSQKWKEEHLTRYREYIGEFDGEGADEDEYGKVIEEFYGETSTSGSQGRIGSNNLPRPKFSTMDTVESKMSTRPSLRDHSVIGVGSTIGKDRGVGKWSQENSNEQSPSPGEGSGEKNAKTKISTTINITEGGNRS